MTNIILDTNIIFSALAFDKILEQVFKLVLENHKKFTVYRSLETTLELKKKLTSKKFLAYRNLALEQVEEILDLYFQKTILITPTKKVTICRDPDDNKFLELAKEIKADFLITGDKDLLEIKQFESTKILKPSKFMTEFNLIL